MKKIILLIVSTYLFANLNITVSILPESYFVQKIAKNHANIQVMVKPGSNPATYEPKPKQLRFLTKSDIYFSIGVPFESRWLKRFKDIAPNLKIIDLSKGIKKRKMQSFNDFDSSQKSKQTTNALDPHIWLSPKAVKKIAKNIKDALVKIDNKNSKDYEKNYQLFLKEIDQMQKYAHKRLDKLKNREFLVFHPVWGYFADEFKLKQIPIQMEGKEPSPKMLIKLINYAKKRGIKAIFVQKEFSKKAAQVIANNIGAKVVVLDPLSKNWSKCLKKAIDAFNSELK